MARAPDAFKHLDPEVNLHVFSLGSDEIDRMLAFRDHLRDDPRDRDLYAATKAELAARSGRTCRTTPTPSPRWSPTS